MADVSESEVQALAEILSLEYGDKVSVWSHQGLDAWEVIAGMVVAVGWEPSSAALSLTEVRSLAPKVPQEELT